jgi:gas vesicle protein
MNFIFGFLAGAAVGAAAALLYAPKSGQEFRTDINWDSNVSEIGSRVEKAVADMQSYVEAQVKQMQAKADEAAASAAEAAEAVGAAQPEADEAGA